MVLGVEMVRWLLSGLYRYRSAVRSFFGKGIFGNGVEQAMYNQLPYYPHGGMHAAGCEVLANECAL